MSWLDYSLRSVDSAGNQVLLKRPGCWDVCDWRERRVLGHFTYDDSYTASVGAWVVDVPRDRVFQSQKGFIRCHSLSDQQELWKLNIRGYEHGSLTLHPRSGDILSQDGMVALRSRRDGTKMKSWVPSQEIVEAFPHPCEPVTLLCRSALLDKTAGYRGKKRRTFEFYQEDTQQYVIAEVEWKVRPFCTFFHGSYCCVEEIGGLIHCFDVRTGQELWRLQVGKEHASISQGAFHQTLGCWVFVTHMTSELWHVDPSNGSILKTRKLPEACGRLFEMFCFVDHGTKLLTIQGKLIDVATLEVIGEGIFARMGLEFETPLDGQVA
ncbi:MAG: hypothetical protein ACOYOF_01140 [Verrucomicrobiaceae bacterium]